MDNIHQHLFGLCWVLLCFDLDVDGGSVSGVNQTGLLGNNPLNLTCSFRLDEGEDAESLVVRRQRPRETQYSGLADFNIRGRSSLYSDASIQKRTDLFLLNGSVTLMFRILECDDEASYECDFSFSKNGILDGAQGRMDLKIEAMPQSPSITPAYNPGGKTFTVDDELEIRCSGEVGRPAGNFVWYGYKHGSHFKTFTRGVDQGQAETINTGPRFCTSTREGTLKLNLTREDNQLVFRCVVNQTTVGAPPSPAEACVNATCTETQPITVEYPVRQEDMAISSNPSKSQYTVGSGVTLKCTVDGNPAPYFRWEKEGDKEFPFQETQTFTLTNLQLRHSGQYRCLANNTVSGVMYNASKLINIRVVEIPTTATTRSAPSSTQAVSQTTRGGREEPVVTAGGGDNTNIIIIVCVILGVLLIIVIVVLVIFKCRKKNVYETDTSAYASKNSNLNNYTPKPDVVAVNEHTNHTYQNTASKNRHDLLFDNKPRSRRGLALDETTDIGHVTMPQV